MLQYELKLMEDLLYLRMNKQRLMYALVLHENVALQVEIERNGNM